jgi:hypothetical protein
VAAGGTAVALAGAKKTDLTAATITTSPTAMSLSGEEAAYMTETVVTTDLAAT